MKDKQTVEEAIEEAAILNYQDDEDRTQFRSYIDGAKFGAQWQSSQQEWIDVKERVPEEGVYVLAITKYRRIIEQSWESFTCQNKEWFEINFTHWMPLPNPPTSKNKDTHNI